MKQKKNAPHFLEMSPLALLLLYATAVLAVRAPLQFSRRPSALSPIFRNDSAAACPDHPFPVPFAGGVLPTTVTEGVKAAVAVLVTPLNATSLPGVSYDIRYGGQVLARAGAGTANRATGAPMRSDALLRIGSITKSFIAVLAFKAAALGLLSLDAPIVKFAPAFTLRDPFSGGNGSDITWRHLLTQRSGLQREPPLGANTSEVLEMLSRTYLLAPVGGPPSYSNLGFALAGHLLAETVFPGARPLEALLDEHILGPLGLTDTGATFTPAVIARLAPSYTAAGVEVPHVDLGWLWPAGGMYASAQNLSAFGAALLTAAAPDASNAGGALGLPPALARELLDVTVLLADGITLVSAPWESALLSPRGYVARSKGGNVEAYSATLTLVPDLALAFAALYNGGVDEGTLANAAAGALLPPLADALAAAAPPPDQGPAPADFEGEYACTVPGAAPDAYVLVQDSYLMLVVPGLLSAPLAWASAAVAGGDAYRVYIPPDTLSCLYDFELAIRGEYVLFGRSVPGGRVTSVSLPGWAPGLVWARS